MGFFILGRILEGEGQVVIIFAQHRTVARLLRQGDGMVKQDVGKGFFIAFCLL